VPAELCAAAPKKVSTYLVSYPRQRIMCLRPGSGLWREPRTGQETNLSGFSERKHDTTDHMPMEIHVRDLGEISIVDVHGRLAIGESAEQLHEALNSIVGRGVHKVVVILNHVTQIDSSGISTLVRVAIGLAREKGSLHLVCGPGRVRDSLTVTRLIDAIPTFETEALALAKF
jgi:anti-anti-sigma factor